MVAPLAPDLGEAFPRELVEFSAKVEAKRDRRRDHSFIAPRYRFFEGEYHGAPLASLKARDWQALDILFSVDDMEVVCTDVTSALHGLWPEPCWEDDPFERPDADTFDFLADYL